MCMYKNLYKVVCVYCLYLYWDMFTVFMKELFKTVKTQKSVHLEPVSLVNVYQ